VSLMQWLKSLFTSRSAAPPAGATQRGELPGRNEPCWCGSGKKYKQCHLRKDSEDRREAAYAAQAAKMAARNAGKNVVTGGGKAGAAKPRKQQEYKEWKGGGKAQ
jgi:uncharacterized protein YecA (UPF0149 family)